jgi:uncharacterized protein YjiS (DUF1127 family)
MRLPHIRSVTNRRVISGRAQSACAREADSALPLKEIAMSSLAECHKPAISPAARVTARGAMWAARGVDMLTRVAGFLERAALGRRALRQLAEADDRMLKDIGLNRSDLRNAAAEPLYSDPTRLLAGRVDETRTHRVHRRHSDWLQPARYY